MTLAQPTEHDDGYQPTSYYNLVEEESKMEEHAGLSCGDLVGLVANVEAPCPAVEFSPPQVRAAFPGAGEARKRTPGNSAAASIGPWLS